MLQINTVTKLDLGVKDENQARDIFIDMNAWYANYPNGTVSIWHKRSGDQTKYAASAVTFDRETGILKWTPDAYDTYYIGSGLAEVRLTENNVIKKTKDILTDVEKSLVLPSGETLTSGWQAYLNQIESDKNQVMQAIGQVGDNVEKSEAWATGKKDGTDVDPEDPAYHNNSKYYAEQAANSADAAEDAQAAAEEAVDHYPYISEVTGNWMVYDANAGSFVDTGTHAQGPQGQTGPQGIQGETGPQGIQGETGPQGETGDSGTNAFVHIRYAAHQPTSDADMSTTPNDWMGVYSGDSQTAPTAYTSYTWYKIKGEEGSIENAYGSTIPMSPTDSTKIETAVNAKLNKNQGAANAGKVMTVDSTGEVIPDDLPPCGVSSATMNGESITPSAAGNLDLGSVIRTNYDDVKRFESVEFLFDTAPVMFSAYNVWTDGNDIYYGDTSSQYILDKTTHTWEDKTFNIQIIGQSVWTDGENVYYSRGNNQYVYNSNTDSWDAKTWTGLTYYDGRYVWTDGENIYYSEDTNHYVLDKSTSTWSTKTWYGLTGVDFFSGSQIWTNNGNIYYSLGGDQFVLDKTTSTWNEKTWYGLDDFSRGSIWTAGENYYYSYSSSNSNSQYVLDQETSTWIQTEWSGLTNPSRSNIWTDGENIYHSSYNFSTMSVVNYQCIIPSKKILIGENGAYSSVDIEDIVPEVSNKIVDLVYPVGSIYMSVASTSPATLFGGTWEQLKDRFLLGAGDTYTAGDTGGAANVSYTPAGTNTGGEVSSHTLTVDEIPAHNHSFTGSAVTSGGISANHTHTGTSGNVSQGHTHTGPSHSHSVGTWDCKGYDSTKGSFKAVAQNSGWLANTTNSAGTGATGGQSANHTHTTTTGNQSAGHSHSVTASGSIGNKGGGGGHSHGFTQPTFTGTEATINTMPPYLSVYMWKRTA